MIRSISVYKEMIPESTVVKSTRPLRKADTNSSSDGVDSAKFSELYGRILSQKSTDTVDLSVSHDVFSAVDNFFNMGRSGRFDSFRKLAPEDKEQFVRIIAELAKSGYMGYEELIVNNKVERHDVANQMGDDRLRGAKLYDVSKYPHH